MSEEKKNFRKLSSYAIIMILAAVIVIIIAAMADNRETKYEDQITEKEQLNVSIQNEIVRLKDENYTLGKEKEALQSQLESQKTAISVSDAINQVLILWQEDRTDEARTALLSVDRSALTPEQTAACEALDKLLAAAQTETNEGEPQKRKD